MQQCSSQSRSAGRKQLLPRALVRARRREIKPRLVQLPVPTRHVLVCVLSKVPCSTVSHDGVSWTSVVARSFLS